MIKVRIKKLSENAVIPFKKHDKDLCYDVRAVSCEEIAPNVYRYGLGLAFSIERPQYIDKDIRISIDFRPRSSVWETGMVLSNCEGTIDEPYRGEVKAIFYHVFPYMPRYQVGDKIGQLKIGMTQSVDWEVVDELDETERGSGGFGSTGK